jgi:hypothetical protein
MNKYEEFKLRQEKAVNAFPIKFTYTKEQFNKAMAELGLTPNDTDKVYRLWDGSCLIRKSNYEAVTKKWDNLQAELKQAIDEDKDGTGFIYEMFAYELEHNDFGYSYDLSDTLDILDMTLPQIKADKKLQTGLSKALRKYFDLD